MKNYRILLLSVFSLLITSSILAQKEVENSQNTKGNEKVLISESSLVSIAKKLQKIKKDKIANQAILEENTIVNTALVKKEKNIDPKNEQPEFKQGQKLYSNHYDNISVKDAQNQLTNQKKIQKLEEENELYKKLLSLYKPESNQAQASFRNDYYNNRINDLQNQLFEQKRLILSLFEQKENIKYHSITIPETKRIQVDKISSDFPDNKERVRKIIEQRIDTLYIAAKDSEKQDSIAYLNQILILRKELEDLAEKIENQKKEIEPEEKVLIQLPLMEYKKQLFFENNKYSLKETDLMVLSEISSIMKDYDNMDVLINGFASNTGSPLYNERLSLLRTDSVKKALIKLGVHPSRILSQYYGIDYSEPNNALARRVDINFIEKK